MRIVLLNIHASACGTKWHLLWVSLFVPKQVHLLCCHDVPSAQQPVIYLFVYAGFYIILSNVEDDYVNLAKQSPNSLVWIVT